MKLVRFGSPGAERPGLVGPGGVIKDCSARVADYGHDFFAGGGLEMLRDLAADSAALPDAPAGTQRAGAKADAIAAAEGMSESIRLVRADIVARIAQRINQSLCAPLMIVLGAVLAIRLRGTNPLQIYLLSFIPAIVDILLISGGEQMLKEATTATGLLVVSAGNLGLLTMIVVAYRQVARN